MTTNGQVVSGPLAPVGSSGIGSLAIAAAMVALCSIARAQVSPVADPVFNGILDVRPARGSIDPQTGNAELKVRRWRWSLTPDSNGIYPDLEPILLALGEESFLIPAGMLRAAGSGNVFAYRAARNAGKRAIRTLRLQRRDDGSYLVRFTVAGVDVSRLLFEAPVCLPMAVIVGDDDGFSGVALTRRNFRTRRISIPGDCDVGASWPWL